MGRRKTEVQTMEKEARLLAGQGLTGAQVGTAGLSPGVCAVPEPSSELAQAGLWRRLLPNSSQLWFLGLLNRRPWEEYAHSEGVAKLNTGGQRATTGWNSCCTAVLTMNSELALFLSVLISHCIFFLSSSTPLPLLSYSSILMSLSISYC